MKILAIDFGERKMGLAVSEGFLSEPLKIIKAQDWEKELSDICQKEKIEKIVLGITEGEMAKKQRAFARALKKSLGLPVDFQSEVLTSKEAIAKMKMIGKRMKDEDAVAAALILQSYLEKNV